MTTTKFGNLFGDDDPLSKIGDSLRSPSLEDVAKNPFAPNFVNSPDDSVTTQMLEGIGFTRIDMLSDDISNPAGVEGEGARLPSFVDGTTREQAKITKTFVPNVLDTYDNVAYNFRLTLAPESQLINPMTEPTGPFFIVADSGMTANYSIKSVEIDSLVGPNAKTRNVRSVSFNMVITESQGVSLIDKLMEASKALGIRNINVLPMILELKFKGYEPNGVPTEVTVAKRSWRVQLIDIQTHMTEGGSEYRLTMMGMMDYAFNRFSAAAQIQQQVTIPIDTVGKFFDDLGYNLTVQSAKAAANGQIARAEYEFVVDPDMRSWAIGDPAEEKNAPSMFIDNGGNRNIVLSTNMTLERIVDTVLASTQEGIQMVNPDSNPDKMDQNPAAPKISKIAQINGKVECIGFNPVANDYIRKYTYYITKFDAFRVIIDTPDEQSEDARAQYIIQDALKKRYDYIFTGQNTSVLNLDLDLNNLWRHVTTYYASGIQRKNNTTSKFIQPELEPTTQDDLREQALSSEYAYNQNPMFQDSWYQSFKTDLDGMQLEQDYSLIDLEQEYDPRMDNIKHLDSLGANTPENQEALRTELRIQDQINKTIPMEGAEANAMQNLPVLLSGNRLKSPTDSGQLLETMNTVNKQDKILNLFSKQIDPQLDSNYVSENIEETTDLGRTVFGVVANQLYGNAQFTNLLKVDMGIRGDPYWLGESDQEIITRLDTNDVYTPKGTEFANYIRGENSFLLSFRTPQNYNDNTGFVDLKNSDLFVGLYNVVRVTHQFNDGKFTQNIEAIRDIQTSAETIAKFIR